MVVVTAAVPEELSVWEGLPKETLAARLASTAAVEVRANAGDFAWAGVMAGHAVARG